jgi:hemerythrin-like domain-containing protein
VCDYCGCRRNPAIDELSAEHDQLLDLLYGLRRAAKRGAHTEVVSTLDNDVLPLLEAHTAKEEHGLFTELRTAWDCDVRLDSLVDEHRDVERRIDLVRSGAPGWAEELHRLADLLSSHIMDEETDLFPYALYELDDGQWNAVAAVHARSGTGRDVTVG